MQEKDPGRKLVGISRGVSVYISTPTHTHPHTPILESAFLRGTHAHTYTYTQAHMHTHTNAHTHMHTSNLEGESLLVPRSPRF